MDEDGIGYVSIEEFYAKMCLIKPYSTYESAVIIFDNIDEDGNEQAELSEFELFVVNNNFKSVNDFIEYKKKKQFFYIFSSEQKEKNTITHGGFFFCNVKQN